MDKKERFIELDCLRIFACILVIISHLVCLVAFDGSYPEWNIANIIYVFRNPCVPLFFMISGSLMLSHEKALPTKKIIILAIRLSIAYLITSVFFSCLDIFKSGIRWNEVNIVEFLNSTLINPKSHLWFIPTMIGVYILSPILKKIVEDKKLTKFYLCIWFIFTVMRKTVLFCISIIQIFSKLDLSGIQSLISNFPVVELNSYCGYFVLGYYLYFRFNKKVKLIYLSFGIVVSTIIPALILELSYSKKGILVGDIYDYFILNSLVASCCMMLIFKDYVSKIRWSKIIEKVLIYISSCTFGVYLLHPYFTEKGFYYIVSKTLIITIPVLSISVFILCTGIISLLKYLPGVKKIL